MDFNFLPIRVAKCVGLCDANKNKKCAKSSKCYTNGGTCYLIDNSDYFADRLSYKHLAAIIKQCRLPDDVTLCSDSGWECGDTEMLGLWYDILNNRIVFKQSISTCDKDYWLDSNYYLLAGNCLFDITEADILKYNYVRHLD